MNSNDLLELKGQFHHRSGGFGGPPTLPAGAKPVTVDRVQKLIKELETVLSDWNDLGLGINPLVSIYYIKVLAKSNRVQLILHNHIDKIEPNKSIVGAQFYGPERDPKHLIIHCVPRHVIESTISELHTCASVIKATFSGEVDSKKLSKLFEANSPYRFTDINKRAFAQLIRDIHFIERIGINTDTEELEGQTIVSFYKTNVETKTILDHYGIQTTEAQYLDDAILLSPRDYNTLRNNAPFLISMSSTDDLSAYLPEPPKLVTKPLPSSIPRPTNEPIVGVIDTGFFENAYFADWVEHHNLPSITNSANGDRDSKDKECKHGTAVCSLIVDGPTLNPSLDDGCGRFRVRHFMVAHPDHNSSFNVMRRIIKIVTDEKNRDITVWNLCLGSEFNTKLYSISPEAAILDRLQYERGIIFVISGTNNQSGIQNLRIGAPADSVNSLVVNAVDFDGNPAPYSRRGPVLSFFAKPDVSYYGGTKKEGVWVAGPHAAYQDYGTSIAAPWIARKMAFLIHKMGLSREVAKALIIDSATGWDKIENTQTLGLGIVPQRIEDVLYGAKDEIRFVISETVQGYETSVSNLPVPAPNNKFPFLAKATLCYFPECDRKQGVDYTKSEVSLTFGCMAERKKKIKDKNGQVIGHKLVPYIKPLNNDSQDLEGARVSEDVARENYRKWDNVKHIGEIFTNRKRPRKAYTTDNWGISFHVKERLSTRSGQGMRVGLVVTLKEMSGKNRVEEFIWGCSRRGWTVNKINIDQRLNIIEKADVEIEFED